MSDFLHLVQSRYSCRDYTDRPVEQEKLDYLVECFRFAPSAVNKQPWRLRIVSSDSDKAALQTCYDRPWFRTAPLYIIIYVRHDEEWVRADGKPHGLIDVAIATEHLCLAATEQGLGTCWVCNFDASRCRELFPVDSEEEPVVLIPVGYPADTSRPKNRKEPNSFLHNTDSTL